jgi:hypothetical protein
MATLAPYAPRFARDDDRFFLVTAIVMALTVVAGFSFQFAMGRSTFASPLRVHVHAVAFMGWVAIFVAQSWLATRGPIALHRTLGWVAAIWMAFMVAAAMVVIVAIARAGHVPFFFTPQQFLVGDPITLIGFVGLTVAAIAMRRRTDWHARLHFCGMAVLISPAFGRLLPMPLLIPHALETAMLVPAIFPVIGLVRDVRRDGRAHRAWLWGLAVIAATAASTALIAPSPIGAAIYRTVTVGSSGADVPGLEFPPPPAGPLRTGR